MDSCGWCEDIKREAEITAELTIIVQKINERELRKWRKVDRRDKFCR
jgi:hypothetical protein